MSSGHGKGQELHVMAQKSKTRVRKSRAQPSCWVGKERWECQKKKSCLKEKGENSKVLRRLHTRDDLRLMRREQSQNHRGCKKPLNSSRPTLIPCWTLSPIVHHRHLGREKGRSVLGLAAQTGAKEKASGNSWSDCHGGWGKMK